MLYCKYCGWYGVEAQTVYNNFGVPNCPACDSGNCMVEIGSEAEARKLSEAFAANYDWSVTAAAQMGRSKSAKKAASSAANGKLGGRPGKRQRAENRMNDFGFGPREMDFIFSDWPNMDEHIAWILRASRDDIQDWIDAGK